MLHPHELVLVRDVMVGLHRRSVAEPREGVLREGTPMRGIPSPSRTVPEGDADVDVCPVLRDPMDLLHRRQKVLPPDVLERMTQEDDIEGAVLEGPGEYVEVPSDIGIGMVEVHVRERQVIDVAFFLPS